MASSDQIEATPQLKAGETIVWKNSLRTKEIASIKISCALYFLVFRFGWVVVLLMAGAGLATFHIEASMAMVGLSCSTALLGTALYLVTHITLQEMLESKEEQYILTNKRIMFVVQKYQKSLNIDSATIKVFNLPGFGKSGAAVFYDLEQTDGATIILYKDDAAALCQVLPAHLAAKIKGKNN